MSSKILANNFCSFASSDMKSLDRDIKSLGRVELWREQLEQDIYSIEKGW